jgi:hypothetical protein
VIHHRERLALLLETREALRLRRFDTLKALNPPKGGFA